MRLSPLPVGNTAILMMTKQQQFNLGHATNVVIESKTSLCKEYFI